MSRPASQNQSPPLPPEAPPLQKETNPNADWDSPWKGILERFRRAFLFFFLPHLAPLVDWEREEPIEFLDKELQKLAPDAQTGHRFVDKLFKVHLKGIGEFWILIHVEIQADAEGEFCYRMFIYHIRLTDRYGRPVLSMAILADSNPNWRPSFYEQEFEGTKIRLDFPIIKLLDYRERWEELEASDNPFALIVMAHLKALETKQDVEARYHWKWELTQLLHQKSYSEAEVMQLYVCLDWLLALPEEASRRFEAELSKWEEERKVEYVTSYERFGIEKGIEQGQQEMLLDQLRLKFSELPDEIEKQVRNLNLAALKQMSARILTAQTLAEMGLGDSTTTPVH